MRKLLTSRRFRAGIGILLTFFAATACVHDDVEVSKIEPVAAEEKLSDLETIASMGYDTTNVVVYKDYYLIEGEIMFAKDEMDNYRSMPKTRINMSYGQNGRLEVKSEFQHIRVITGMLFVPPSVDFSNPLTKAMNTWNAVQGCNIAFGYGSGAAEIEVQTEDMYKPYSSEKDRTTLLKVDAPTADGKPGKRILINSNYPGLPKSDDIQAQYLMMHALGHALGFAHTPRSTDTGTLDGVPVSGTAARDDYSIMTKEKNPLSWSGFSAEDKKAFKIVYPASPALNISGPKTVNEGESHAYTLSGMNTPDMEADVVWSVPEAFATVEKTEGTRKTKATVKFNLKGTVVLKATVTARDGRKYDQTITITVQRTFSPGSIADQVVVDTADLNATFVIASKTDGTASDGAVSYSWEQKLSGTWTVVAGATAKTLTTPVPQRYQTEYRRSSNQNGYSNICTVYNDAYLSGGKIPENVVINEYRFPEIWISLEELIPSLASAIARNYRWEVDAGNGWEDAAGEYGLRYHQYMLKFRRVAKSFTKEVYSNECTLINKFFEADPLAGGDPEHPYLVGSYGDDFVYYKGVDTRGSQYNITNSRGGRAAWMELNLTQDMEIALGVHTPFFNQSPMQVHIINAEELPALTTSSGYWDLLANIEPYWVSPMYYTSRFDGFPPFEQDLPPGEYYNELFFWDGRTVVSLDTGKYYIAVSGQKSSNAGLIDAPIHLTIAGRLAAVGR